MHSVSFRFYVCFSDNLMSRTLYTLIFIRCRIMCHRNSFSIMYICVISVARLGTPFSLRPFPRDTREIGQIEIPFHRVISTFLLYRRAMCRNNERFANEKSEEEFQAPSTEYRTCLAPIE